jgi:gamma-glutamyltranspeptidase
LLSAHKKGATNIKTAYRTNTFEQKIENHSDVSSSSGGICLNQIMKMIEPFNLSQMGHNSVKTISSNYRSRTTYADRNYF